MNESWRLIVNPPADGRWNMGVDSTLLECATTPVLRLYGWDKPTLSIGYAQKPETDVNLAFLEAENIPLVRRPTGGRAILHWDELTYAVVIPSHSKFFGSLPEMYATIALPIRNALTSLGLSLDDGGRAAGIRNNPCCFATRLGHEISVNGKKIVGSAQRRLKTAALQHGSIVLSIDAERYANCLNFTDLAKRNASLSLLGGMNDFVTRPITRDELATAVKEAFARTLELEFEESGLTEEEMRRAKVLAGKMDR
ncbi:MAG: lipoate--protein ligase family protein [Nitrospinae bacterium]|nr:lipoate--protein ligase family protein [Nitrospinota bacterium]